MKRGGFVLAVVLFAVVLLSALAAGGFFAAFQETRAGRNAQGSVRARQSAEAALAHVVAGWDPRILNTVAPGNSVAVSAPATAGTVVSVVSRRLDEHLFLLRARALESNGADQELGVIVRLLAVETVPAAVRAKFIDPVLGAFASGVDVAPVGWVCPPTSDTMPAVVVQPAMPDSQFFRLGPMDWAGVVAWAAGTAAGGDSLVVRHVAGDLVLSGGRSLGVMVVEGDLTLQNGAEHVGLVLVHGKLVLDGLGGTVSGSVVSSQVVAANGYNSLSYAVVYSSCAVRVSSLSRALPRPLPGLPTVGFF